MTEKELTEKYPKAIKMCGSKHIGYAEESMKPILIEDKMWTCPICGNNLMHKYKKYPTLKYTKKDALTFCLSCGCGIDWAEVGGDT